jgi:hypothetical protein
VQESIGQLTPLDWQPFNPHKTRNSSHHNTMYEHQAPPPSAFNKYSDLGEVRFDCTVPISRTKPRLLLWREELNLAVECKHVSPPFADVGMVRLGAPECVRDLLIFMPISQLEHMTDITKLMRMHAAASRIQHQWK